MRSAKPGFWLGGVWLVSLLCAPLAHSTLVTVQSLTQEHMDTLTDAVNRASAADYTGTARVTLGTIEATMSRVVDMDSEYLLTVAESVPTLQLLGEIHFNSSSQTWHLQYQVMGRDETSDLNQYMRTLYLTKGGNAHAGDHENTCLTESVSDNDCLQQLRSDYVVPPGELSASHDNLLFELGSIRSSLTTHPSSLVQTLDLSIPHRTVVELLARRETRTSLAFGDQQQYSFGVGMLFLLPGRNTIIFDSFELVENAQAQAVVTKTVSYSIARHVSFFTEVVQSDERIRLVSIEYLVEAGHELRNLSTTVNGHEVSQGECELAAQRIAALADPTCLAGRAMCAIELYNTGSGPAGGYTWVTFTAPIPAAVSGGEGMLLVNTLLDTVDRTTGTQVWSAVNFKTSSSPRPVCTEVQVTAFNRTQYARATLYESVSLHAQELSSTTHSVSNHTVDGRPALSMADALLTLVLSPGQSADALAYFTSNPEQELRLDEVYMSHAKPYVEFAQDVRNTLLGVSAGDGTYTGRSSMILDPRLVQTCPLESGAGFTYGAERFDCVTTQDWGVAQGAMQRPFSHVHTSFVHEVTHTPADVAWLRSNIFGSSDVGLAAAADFVSRLEAKTSADRRAHTRTYWIWPLYAWPSESPVGLKDKTVLSLAWSLGAGASPGPDQGSRRLLAAPPAPAQPPPARVFHALPVRAVRRGLWDAHARRPAPAGLPHGQLVRRMPRPSVGARPVHTLLAGQGHEKRESTARPI